MTDEMSEEEAKLRLYHFEPWEKFKDGGRERAYARLMRFGVLRDRGMSIEEAEAAAVKPMKKQNANKRKQKAQRKARKRSR
jgi:hypothetical protein